MCRAFELCSRSSVYCGADETMATATIQPVMHTQNGAPCLHDGHVWPLQACTSPTTMVVGKLHCQCLNLSRHLPLFQQGAGEKPTLRVECASFHHTYCGPSLLGSAKLEITIAEGWHDPLPLPSLATTRVGRNYSRWNLKITVEWGFLPGPFSFGDFAVSVAGEGNAGISEDCRRW
jgi:hypothetical protein